MMNGFDESASVQLCALSVNHLLFLESENICTNCPLLSGPHTSLGGNLYCPLLSGPTPPSIFPNPNSFQRERECIIQPLLLSDQPPQQDNEQSRRVGVEIGSQCDSWRY